MNSGTNSAPIGEKLTEIDGITGQIDEQYSTSDYNNKLELLNRIIASGINKLLNEASQRNYLDAPYG